MADKQLDEVTNLARPSLDEARQRDNSLLSTLVGNTSVILTIVSGIAYILGVQSVANFAEQMGASPSDLGVEFRDYVVMALFPLVPPLTLAGSFLAGYQLLASFRPRPTLQQITLPLMGLIGLLMIFRGALATYADNSRYTVISWSVFTFSVGAGLTFASIAQTMEMTLEHAGARVHKSGTRIVRLAFASAIGLSAVVTVVPFVATAPRQWADDLRLWANGRRTHKPEGPLGLESIFEPALAQVELDGQSLCVVRVGGRVLLFEDTTIIADEPATAVVGACEVEIGRGPAPIDAP